MTTKHYTTDEIEQNIHDLAIEMEKVCGFQIKLLKPDFYKWLKRNKLVNEALDEILFIRGE